MSKHTNHYDPQTSQMIIGEDVYDPEYVPNPQYIGGIKRAALIGFEVTVNLGNIISLNTKRK